MCRADGSHFDVDDCLQQIKIRCYKIYRADGSHLDGYCKFNWTEVQPYKMYRADGSVKCKSSVGTIYIVATDFNPLMI